LVGAIHELPNCRAFASGIKARNNFNLYKYFKIIRYDNDCPIIIKLYTINGKLVKTIKLNNGMVKSFDINDIKSGTYLVAGISEFTNERGISTNVSDSEIIIIEK